MTLQSILHYFLGKAVAASVLDGKRTQNIWIVVKSFRNNNITMEKIQTAMYEIDLSEVDLEKLQHLKENQVILRDSIFT